MKGTDRGFIFFYDWGAAFEQMSAENVKKVLLAIIDYAQNGVKPPKFTGEAALVAGFIFPSLERRQYISDVAKKRAENRWNKSQQEPRNDEAQDTPAMRTQCDSNAPAMRTQCESDAESMRKGYDVNTEAIRNGYGVYTEAIRNDTHALPMHNAFNAEGMPAHNTFNAEGMPAHNTFNAEGMPVHNALNESALKKVCDKDIYKDKDKDTDIDRDRDRDRDRDIDIDIDTYRDTDTEHTPPVSPSSRGGLSRRDVCEKSKESIYDMSEEERQNFFNQRRREISHNIDEYLFSS